MDKVKMHFDKIAKDYDFYKKKNSYYYDNLKKLLAGLIPKSKRVFEIGCGTGDLLNHLRPKYGYGYDISREMISISKSKFLISNNLTFSTKWPKGSFDYIFMADVIEHLENSKETFQKISNLMGEKSIFICTMMNPLWEPVALVWEWLGWKMPEGPHTRIKNYELRIMMKNAGMRITKHDYKLLMPVKILFITNFANKYLERPFRRLAFIEYFLAVKV
jgi:SAM-dependent methyltransferase